MSSRGKIRISSYITAALASLSLFGLARSADLADSRLAADTSAGRAFEETVNAVSGLSEALAKSVYATDDSMCDRICSEAYAHALAAESALSILPFATQELEQISAFLNVAGDYAYSLCGSTQDGFSDAQQQTLCGLAATASGLVDSLLELQNSVHSGEVVMDRVPLRLQNIPDDTGAEPVSERLLACEADFQPPEAVEYDGKYSCKRQEAKGYLTEDAMLALAAEYAGVPVAALKQAYAYEGTNGRRCYQTDDLFLCVSRCGVESMAQSRLVGDVLLSREEAQTIAEDFLTDRGFQDLELTGSEQNGAVAAMVFSRREGEAVCLDNVVQISVALDDGSIYSFNAADYCGEDCGARFTVDENRAAQALPERLKLLDGRKVILKSPGKRDLACYEFTCSDGEERQLRIYVDAATGKQYRIDL